jgi:hypothetical protein
MLKKIGLWKCNKFKTFWKDISEKKCCMDKQIKRTLNSENACYCSVQNILSFCYLSKSTSVNIGKYNLDCRVVWLRNLVYHAEDEYELRCWGYLGWEGGSKRCLGENFATCIPRKNINRIIKFRKMKWSGCVSHLRMKRNVYMDLMEKCEGKKLRWKPRHRWEGIIKVR